MGNGGDSNMPESRGTNQRSDHRADPWPDLVVAMLAVNNYPLAKAYDLVDALKAGGLCDPRNLARWDDGELARRLAEAGYSRGTGMTAIFVERLSSLGRLAEELEAHEKILSSGTREEVAQLLSRVKGVGPVVLSSFLLLRG